jgi:hypothetical protein
MEELRKDKYNPLREAAPRNWAKTKVQPLKPEPPPVGCEPPRHVELPKNERIVLDLICRRSNCDAEQRNVERCVLRKLLYDNASRLIGSTEAIMDVLLEDESIKTLVDIPAEVVRFSAR